MSTPHALIIDDNSLNIDVLQMLLEDSGLQSISLVVPRSDKLSQLPAVDVIFLDLEFPNYDGFQLLTTLRTYPQFRDVPIIAYSVHTSEIDNVRQAGFNGFLGKPLDARKFPAQLQRILNGESVWEIS